MTVRRLAAALALSLALLGACSDDDSPGTGAPVSSTRDLAEFDAFVLASAENDPAAADVYGLRFTPFTVERITTDKRVSALGADEQHLVVAAADQGGADRLAEVTGTGELTPIAGLGRPAGYSPTLRDGVLYFDDAGGKPATGKFRFFTYDLATRTKKLVYRSTKDLGAPKPLADGRLLVTVAGEDGQDRLAIRDKAGKVTALPALGDIAVVRPGEKLVAVTLVRPAADGPAQALLLFNPDTGEKQVIPNLQMVAWSPDGRQFLARRTESPTDSRLVVLDPTKDPVELGTIPNLAIYGGVWVRGVAG